MFNYYSFIVPILLFSAVPLIIVVSVVVYFINRNHNSNNMDPNQPMKPRATAGDFLLNIASIIALYTVVSNLISLLFSVINSAYPQITNGYNYYGSQSISWPVSILIILFPIFVTIMWFLEKSYAQEPEKRNIGIHKWLTYITLFIGGIILIGDLITVIYRFIDGQELTTGFLLKVFSVLLVTLVVFLYYVADVRNTLTSAKKKIWLVVSTALILFSIVWGFSVLGSPRTQQLIKYDTQKVSDLQNISNQINNYYSNKGVLPNSFDELKTIYYSFSTVDSQTQKPYEYKKLSETTYNICAEFNKASDDKNINNAPVYSDPYNSITWTHSAGRYCFEQTINPNLYSKPVPMYQ